MTLLKRIAKNSHSVDDNNIALYDELNDRTFPQTSKFPSHTVKNAAYASENFSVCHVPFISGANLRTQMTEFPYEMEAAGMLNGLEVLNKSLSIEHSVVGCISVNMDHTLTQISKPEACSQLGKFLREILTMEEF